MWRDVRQATRRFLREPALSAAAVATLGPGLAASLAVFTLVNALLLRALALSLATVGIYGVYAYATASRLPEIGVRFALGTPPRRILFDVIGRAVRLGGVATIAGLAVALVLTRVVRSELFGVSATDPLTYAMVGVLLMVTVFAAALMPALRAARVDPLVAMRR